MRAENTMGLLSTETPRRTHLATPTTVIDIRGHYNTRQNTETSKNKHRNTDTRKVGKRVTFYVVCTRFDTALYKIKIVDTYIGKQKKKLAISKKLGYEATTWLRMFVMRCKNENFLSTPAPRELLNSKINSSLHSRPLAMLNSNLSSFKQIRRFELSFQYLGNEVINSYFLFNSVLGPTAPPPSSAVWSPPVVRTDSGYPHKVVSVAYWPLSLQTSGSILAEVNGFSFFPEGKRTGKWIRDICVVQYNITWVSHNPFYEEKNYIGAVLKWGTRRSPSHPGRSTLTLNS